MKKSKPSGDKSQYILSDLMKVSKKDVARLRDLHPTLEFKLLFWIADLLSYSTNSTSRKRVDKLNDYQDEQIPPMFFNESYFSKEEALALMGLRMTKEKSCTFGKAFSSFTDDRLRRNNGQVCTSSEVAPFLCQVLRIDQNFIGDKTFKKHYAAFQKNIVMTAHKTSDER